MHGCRATAPLRRTLHAACLPTSQRTVQLALANDEQPPAYSKPRGRPCPQIQWGTMQYHPPASSLTLPSCAAQCAWYFSCPPQGTVHDRRFLIALRLYRNTKRVLSLVHAQIKMHMGLTRWLRLELRGTSRVFLRCKRWPVAVIIKTKTTRSNVGYTALPRLACVLISIVRTPSKSGYDTRGVRATTTIRFMQCVYDS